MKYYVGKNGKFIRILEPQELADNVLQNLLFYKEEMEEARMIAARTQEEIAADIENKFAEENARLNQQLKFSIASVASEKELEEYNNFVSKHLICRQTLSTGGAAPIIMQHGTGIGVCTTLKCPVCLEEKDITDTSVW